MSNQDHLTPFRTIQTVINDLYTQEHKNPDPSLTAARSAVEDALNVWVDAVEKSDRSTHILMTAMAEFNDAQLQNAIRKEGNPVYARIFDAMGQDIRSLRLPAIRIRRLNNGDVDTLIARGFNYHGAAHHTPAAEWMVRGAAYGREKFRAKHPRKSPVVAYWEERGMSLPLEGLCPEGAKMVADLMRDNDRLPKKVRDAAERSARSTDWRIALCMRITGHPFPYTLSGVLGAIFGGEERKEAISKLFARPTSNHEKLLYEGRMARLPSLEDILMLPSDKESIDLFLEGVGMITREDV